MYEENGKYYWTYHLDLKKNLSILAVVFKIMGVVFFVMSLIIVFLNKGYTQDFFKSSLTAVGVSMGVVSGITLIAYWILALIYEGTYTMLYEMSEDGIRLSQTEKGVELSKMLTCGPTGTYSKFRDVRIIKPRRKRDLIYVVSPLLVNMVYVSPEYFDFVFDYIADHCLGARIR